MARNIVFKPRARLLLQLGDQLIKNESIALLELVKNSYDADATDVTVEMKEVDNPTMGTIVVEDNGTGMDIDIVTNVWMEPASDYKEKLLHKRRRSPKFHRLPLGEKGIGRFSAYKLGSEIELITRKAQHKEIVIRVNWDAFIAPKYLEDVSIEVHERKPEVFKGNGSGTKIIIRKLKKPWDRGMLREVYRSVNSLRSPFEAPGSFRINMRTDRDEWLAGLLTWDDIKNLALFSVECEMAGQHIKKFTYKFMPWPAMKKMRPRTVTERSKEVKKKTRMVLDNLTPIDLSRNEIGPVKFEALIFDRDPRILELGLQDKAGFKEYLDTNGGIRIYRDGMRVYDYGEPGNDWLNLGLRRVNLPTKRISNNLIIGAIHLTRYGSRELIEKTNREGFIDNEAYRTFENAVLYALDIVETLRGIDKEKIRLLYGPTRVSEPVVTGISELKKLVEKRIRNEKLKDDISRYLERIEEDYNFINETLLRSAGAGLSLSVVIHEVEKIIDELKQVISREKPSQRIVQLVRHLAELVEGYSTIIRKTGQKAERLGDLIDQALFNIEFRLHAHRIKVIKHYSIKDASTRIRCARNLVIGSILNIIDNSIWWLEYGKVSEKKIYLSISKELRGFLALVIADNGPGFSLPTEQLGKPFVSAKPNGMGLGLHIAKSVMEAHGGELLFPSADDFSVPREYREGAVVILAFRNEPK